MRATIIVMDSLGVGQLPDAARYGDEGADTLGHILDNYPLDIPNLRKLGLGNIQRPEDPSGKVASGRLSVSDPEGIYGRLKEKSAGKDTITGHWEIAGIETKVPFKTYHDGFPKELMDEFEKRIGRGYLGNCVASGTEIIEELGDEHEATGKVIVYTSADSVFQIAANTDVVPLDELYRICEVARTEACWSGSTPAAASSRGRTSKMRTVSGSGRPTGTIILLLRRKTRCWTSFPAKV